MNGTLFNSRPHPTLASRLPTSPRGRPPPQTPPQHPRLVPEVERDRWTLGPLMFRQGPLLGISSVFPAHNLWWKPLKVFGLGEPMVIG